MNKLLRFKHMRTQLTVALLLVAVIPLVVAGAIIYQQRVQAIKTESFAKLQGIRDLKVREVHRWLHERINDASVVANDEEIRRATEALAAGEESPEAQDAVLRANKLVQRVQKGSGVYDEIFIVASNSAKSILSTSALRLGDKDYSGDLRFLEPLRTGEPFLRDIYVSATTGYPTMSVSAAVFGMGETPEVVGVLIARVGLENSLYKILLDRAGMGETGETLIVNQDVIAVNELRHDEGAALKLKVDAEPAVLAAQGNTGVTETEDYRGEMVLAAYTHIDEMKWGFIAKQDLAEVYAPIRMMLRSLLLVFLLTAAAAGVFSFFLAGSIVRPMLALTNVAEKLKSGDLTARSTVRLSNELGQLADSFNAMGDALEAQMYVQAKSAVLSDSLASSPDLSTAAQTLVENILETTNSDLAVFYTQGTDGKTFEHLASVGANSALLAPFDGSIREGGLGRVLSSKKITRVSDIPDDTHFVFRTASGAALPKEMLALPLVVDHAVKAVVCLASVKGYSTVSLEALERAWPNLNIAMANLLANQKTRTLADELSGRNKELEAQASELKAQASELKSQTTELKSQAVELEAQRVQVEEANRLKSEFLSNMSHELRTPLNSVITLSELMTSRGPGKNPEKDTEYLRIIQHNGYHLLHLINDILDLSKIEAGRMEVSLDGFEPSSPLERAAEATRPLAIKKGLDLQLSIGDAPAMHSDEEKVYQILLNLISNAVKFTQVGSINVAVSGESDQIVFTVKDTGIGIANSHLNIIFDEFRQVDGSTTRQHEGTGLGLSICQRLAHLLGGEITVESLPDEGSTFFLYLPVRCPELASGAPAPRIGSPPKLGQRVSWPKPPTGKTVLVVDDEPEVCKLLQSFFEESGYEVVTAQNGSDALRLAEELHPFAITLDIMMPNMDGWEILAKLKASEATADIPVIIVSVSEDRATGKALGATAFVPKPVTKELLLDELQRLSRWRTVRNILVVDDDPTVREYFSSILEEKGYRVVAVPGGKEALESFSSCRPDALVLDLMMPEMDGFTVLDKLREDPATYDLPVIVVTAKDLTPQEQTHLSDTTERVIRKGVMARARLLQELEATLDRLGQQALQRGAKDKPRILVVEDNEIAALQVQTALEENGFEVVVAPGGEEALASFSQVLPDAVVLDLMMPMVDGFEVLERIRSTPWTCKLPVLVLTAKELSSEDRARLSHNDVQELIQKGAVKRDELVARVRKMIRGHNAPAAPTPPKPEPKAATPLDSGAETKRAPSGDGRTILIVEDNPDNMFTITELLDGMGYTYVKAESGAQGVEMAKQLRPAIILMDIQLPGLSGLDATRQIRQTEGISKIPIIAMTAKAMRGDKEEALAAGCDAYVSKPLDTMKITELIRQWLA